MKKFLTAAWLLLATLAATGQTPEPCDLPGLEDAKMYVPADVCKNCLLYTSDAADD